MSNKLPLDVDAEWQNVNDINWIKTSEINNLTLSIKDKISKILNYPNLEETLEICGITKKWQVLSINWIKYTFHSVSWNSLKLLKKTTWSDKNEMITMNDIDFTNALKSKKVNVLNKQIDQSEKDDKINTAIDELTA